MRKAILIGLLCALALPLNAQNNTTRFFIAYDYENITVDNTAGGKAFTASKVRASDGPANKVEFTVDCASGTDCPIRYTMDGTAPTTSIGMRAVYRDTVIIYSLTNITAFRAIREGATSAIINVQYYR